MAVIIVGAPADDAHRSRMTALAEAHRRREKTFVSEKEAPGPPNHSRAHVLDQALQHSWGDKVDAKHRKAIRRIPGAIIHFPLVDGGVVDTFITDWSPLPGACAIAVHPGHELATAEGFTGRYARHPLTGDLIPVWTADWVRPDFGTGAVVVNPAHSQVDLDFARKTGLPIRFALADQPPTADPQTWPEPPVVKQGVTRTGQPYDVAAEQYIKELQEHGHAEQTTLPHLSQSHPNPELLQTLRTDPHATVIATADAVTKDLLWARVALAQLNETASPMVVTDIPVYNQQQVDSAVKGIAKKEPGEPDEKLLTALREGDFAAAFKMLKSTRDRDTAAKAVYVLFGTVVP